MPVKEEKEEEDCLFIENSDVCWEGNNYSTN